MFCGRDFDVSDPSEVEVYCLDFVNDLAPGDAIVSAIWYCTVSSGVDANPSARLSGTPWLVNTTQTTQLIAGGLAGVSYILQAVAKTAFGMTISLWSHARVEYLT